MSTCSVDDWMEMQMDYHKSMAVHLQKSLVDYKNGDFWYVVECLPCYSDIPRRQPDISATGERGESKHEVIARAEKEFMSVYDDRRPHSIMRIVWLCFKNGYSLEMKEIDHSEYD